MIRAGSLVNQAVCVWGGVRVLVFARVRMDETHCRCRRRSAMSATSETGQLLSTALVLPAFS